MSVKIYEISDKYIQQLSKKKIFKSVGFNDAVTSLKHAVEETADAAKKEIESAVEPLKQKIAQKDEFISRQTAENTSLTERITKLQSKVESQDEVINKAHKDNLSLQSKNDELQEINSSLNEKIGLKDSYISKQAEDNETLKQQNGSLQQTVKLMGDKLEKYENVYKEAYRQGITPEIKEQKKGIADILSGLLNHKQKPVQIKENIVESEVQNIQQPANINQTKAVEKVKSQKPVRKAHPKTDSKIIAEIEQERTHQRLDTARINRAAAIIRALLEDAPQDKFEFRGVQTQFKKTMDKYVGSAKSYIGNRYNFETGKLGRIRVGRDESGKVILRETGIDFNGKFHPYKYEISLYDGSTVEIYDGNADSYIKFSDTEGKDLLKIRYGENYGISISDKNGRRMVATGIKNGVVKYLNVIFNDVKPIRSIENDAQMNDYAQGIIAKAKKNCVSKQSDYRDTTDIDYYNPDGKVSVHEYFVNKKKNSVPIFSYLYNIDTGILEKLISTGDFGLHAKFDKDTNRWVQYETKGITSISKRRQIDDLNDFYIGFYKSTENEHFETLSLYDKNYEGDKDKCLQRAVYEKFNYGTASHPLTKWFTFMDLTKHNIKPWDFSILKPYLK